MKISVLINLIVCLVGSIGCSSYLEIGNKAETWIDQKKYSQVLELYDDELEDSSRERLLYLLDKGTVYQMSGQYRKSQEMFLEADRLADELDAISLTSQAGAFLSNDETIPYKGEDYEKIMINAFNALNFIAVEDYESALVECRRANEKLEVLSRNEGQQYREDAFIYYLSALLYEQTGAINDAYIDYKRTFQLNPDFPYLKDDLLRLSAQLRFMEDFEKWQKHYRVEASSKSFLKDKDKGELVVIYMAGKSPRKVPHQRNAASLTIGYVAAGSAGLAVGGDFLIPVPRFRKRPYSIHQLKVWNGTTELAQSEELENLEAIGIQSLRDRLGREVIRAMTRLAAKAKLQDEVRKQFGGVAGLVVGTGMLLTQKADVRSWQTLPASLQVARARLEPGEHTITLRYYDKSGGNRGGDSQRSIRIEPRKKTFLLVRTTK